MGHGDMASALRFFLFCRFEGSIDPTLERQDKKGLFASKGKGQPGQTQTQSNYEYRWGKRQLEVLDEGSREHQCQKGNEH